MITKGQYCSLSPDNIIRPGALRLDYIISRGKIPPAWQIILFLSHPSVAWRVHDRAEEGNTFPRRTWTWNKMNTLATPLPFALSLFFWLSKLGSYLTQVWSTVGGWITIKGISFICEMRRQFYWSGVTRQDGFIVLTSMEKNEKKHEINE